MAGFFPHGTRGGTCGQNNLVRLLQTMDHEEGGESGSKVYLLGLLVDEVLPPLFPTALGVSCHLLRSGVPGLKDRQPRPRLLCIKQKGSQVKTK